jgi:hypothetical protein
MNIHNIFFYIHIYKKQMVKAKKAKKEVVENDPFKDMTEEKLSKLKVNGKGGLRDFIVKNKIFSGISNLSKKQLISDTLISEWWRDNVINKGKKPPKKVAPKKTAKGVEKLPVSEDLKKRQKLQNELRECEARIKKRDDMIKKKDDELKKRDEKDTEELKARAIEALEDVKEAETPKEKKEAIKELVEDVVKTDVVEKALSRPDNVAIAEPLQLFEMLSKKMGASVDKLPEEDKDDIKDGLKKAIDKEIKAPIDKEIKKVVKKEIKGVSSDNKTAEQHGLISHHGNGSIDVGHTVINLYTNGSQHPDFPIPQSVVRQALQAQQMPLQEQHRVAEGLRTYVPESPPIQGIPKEVIPREVPHPSHSSIRSRFEKQSSVPPVKKFPTVKPPDRVKKPQTKPPVAQKEEPEEEFKPSAFDDDSEEEESPADKARRLRQEQVAKETGRSKGKGKTDKFKNKLEGLLGKPRSPPK